MKTLSLVLCLAGFSVLAADVSEVRVRAEDQFGEISGAVLMRCQTKAGDPYDPITVSRDVHTLESTGEFEDVRVTAEQASTGVSVTFVVRRKWRYHAPLVVKGNRRMSESEIADEAGLVDGYLYSESDLKTAASKIKAYYQKNDMYDATITPSVRPLSAAVNDAQIVFTIFEGRRCELDKYDFIGNAHVEKKILLEAINVYPWWNPMGWFTDEPVSKEELSQAVAKIEEVYRDRGYLDIKVDEPKRVFRARRNKFNVVFPIEEGVRYEIASSKITGLTRYPEAAVVAKSDLPPDGAVAGLKTLNDAAHRIKVAVGSGDSGLADSSVEVKRIPVEGATNRLDIVYKVNEGVPVVIDNVVIRGNDYTKDRVIRREIALGPGDRMLEDRAERSQHRLENLDYFSRVRYYLEASGRGKNAEGAEYRNLVYEVDEKNTGAFMVGLGASSVDQVYVTAEISQSNFDLFAPSKMFRGGGQKGRASVQWGPRVKTIETSVVEPYLFGRLLELEVEAYRRGRWYDEYDLYRSGASVGLSYPVKFWPTADPFGRLGFRLSGEFIEFDDVESGYYDYNGESVQYFKDQDREYGDAFEVVGRIYWRHDTRNNFRTPTEGSRTQIFADLAGADNEYWRFGFEHRNYHTIWKRYGHVLMMAVKAETIDDFSDGVPIYNRMFLGGPRSIRGIKYRNVSPIIKETDGGDEAPIGGQTLFCANFEYTVPIISILRIAAFSDLGGIGDDSFDLDISDTFAWTVGLGLRIDIPMFPIRIDFATPIEKGDDADDEVFSFTIGYDF